MRILIQIVVLIVILYMLYFAIPQGQRGTVIKFIGIHLFRIVLLIAGVLLCAAAAYFFTASSVLPSLT